MKKFFSLGISLMLFSFITSSLYAATPLVDAVWVKDQIGKEGVVMIDLRTPASYKKGHVPGAVYTNYSKDGWRVKKLRGNCGHASASGTNQQSDRQPGNRQSGSRGLDSIRYQFEQDGNSNPYLLDLQGFGTR